MKSIGQVVLNRWNNFINSGQSVDQINGTLLYQIKLLNSLSIVGIISLLLFGIVNLLSSNNKIGVTEIMASFIGIINLLFYRKSLNYKFAVNTLLIGMIVMLNILLITGGINGTGIYWYCTFPPLAYFFWGKNKGIFWVLLLFTVGMLIYILSYFNVLPKVYYTIIEIRQMVFSILALSFMIGFYEKVLKDKEYIIEKQEKDGIIKNIYDKQLEHAGKIQKNYIPKESITNDKLDVSGYYKPAIEIGGDYFDFFNLSENKTGFIIADVSSKGVPAALVMVKFRTIIKMLLRSNIIKPAKLFSELNLLLYKENIDEMFITSLLVIYDKEEQSITILNAGHQPLIYYSKQKNKIYSIKAKSPPLGIFTDVKYNVYKINIKENDILVMYTDGITEMFNQAGIIYGKQRLLKQISKTVSLSSKNIIDGIVTDVFNFNIKNNKQDDDIALVTIKIK
ncbi:MAG: SpoIIE family protein phosphatase [Spirochaetia bacterium]|nr:SpoIIE family protein phosphatase [Spirochaetia bacterium]